MRWLKSLTSACGLNLKIVGNAIHSLKLGCVTTRIRFYTRAFSMKQWLKLSILAIICFIQLLLHIQVKLASLYLLSLSVIHILSLNGTLKVEKIDRWLQHLMLVRNNVNIYPLKGFNCLFTNIGSFSQILFSVGNSYDVIRQLLINVCRFDSALSFRHMG